MNRQLYTIATEMAYNQNLKLWFSNEWNLYSSCTENNKLISRDHNQSHDRLWIFSQQILWNNLQAIETCFPMDEWNSD